MASFASAPVFGLSGPALDSPDAPFRDPGTDDAPKAGSPSGELPVLLHPSITAPAGGIDDILDAALAALPAEIGSAGRDGVPDTDLLKAVLPEAGSVSVGLADFRSTGSVVAGPAVGAFPADPFGDAISADVPSGFEICGCGLCGGGERRSLNADYDINGAGGPGMAEMLVDIDPTDIVQFSGDRNVDATLFGSRWTITDLTFSFPTDGAFYGTNYVDGENLPANFVAFNAMQQAAVRYALDLVSQYTGLTFTEITETSTEHATLRFSQTNLDSVGSAYANFPGVQPFAGDVWFGRTGQPFYDTPDVGNWGMATQMHEIGHALGLKHGHQDYTSFDLTDAGGYNYFAGLLPDGSGFNGTRALEPEVNGQSWTLMSYDLAPGFTGFGGEGFNQPQTYQMFDIAALQFLYGANYSTQAGNTVYTFNSTTGRMFIDGVGQAAPTSNTILRTLWDGNGVDTLDLSNYTTDMIIDLRPGGFSTFDRAQLADHNARNGGGAPAEGNVALARLVNGDLRSLIENATGGSGEDLIIGNQGNNVLIGGNEGLRQTYDGPGELVDPADFGNVSIATARSIDGLFGQDENPDIEDSTTNPHVSIMGTGNGTSAKYYSFTVLDAGTRMVFDVDYARGGGVDAGFDSWIELYDAAGTRIAFNDDGGGNERSDPGSVSGLDSRLDYTIDTAGTYTIAIGRHSGLSDLPDGATFELQVSSDGRVVAPFSTAPRGDTIFGGGGADIVEGGRGGDTMDGGDGIDTLSYASDTTGVDVYLFNGYTARGQAQGDVIAAFENVIGGSGNDVLLGNAGGNVLVGGNGIDFLSGLAGADRLSGGGGNDTLLGGQGADSLNGGLGNDTLSYTADRAGVNVYLFNGYAQGGEATGDTFTNVENVLGGLGIDVLIGDERSNILIGSGGIDFLSGLNGADRIAGGVGNDTLLGGQGADSLNGGAGIDTLSYTTDRTGVRINLGAGTASGGDAAGDTFFNVENVLGGIGNDVLIGDAGANFLIGSGGADVLAGQGGNDRLAGGAGADTFIFANGFGQDIINDFRLSEIGERISLAAVTAIRNWADLSANHLGTDSNGFAEIEVGTNTLTLRNVAAADLTADDFLF